MDWADPSGKRYLGDLFFSSYRKSNWVLGHA